jgi:hypothetical protein
VTGAVSGNGQVMLACQEGGYMHVSTDSGLTWTPQTSLGTHNWTMSRLSNGGSLMMACGDDKIYISYNTGQSWSLTYNPPTNIYAGIIAGDGSLLVASSNTTAVRVTTPYDLRTPYLASEMYIAIL